MRSPRLTVVRNEVEDAHCFHCDALVDAFDDPREIDFPGGERLDPNDVNAVVLSGSTAGVYEGDRHPWIADLEELIRRLKDARVPTLGICFGHQAINHALGGEVERRGMLGGLVELSLTADPLFSGVNPVVPTVHQDHVVEPGRGMAPIARAEHSRYFATRHQRAPIWTLQAHPEFTAEHVDVLRADFAWAETGHSFEAVNARRICDNFVAIVDRAQRRA